MSANTEAYWALPWNTDEKAAIRSAWDWARETPVVRGSYYTNRYLVNAINRARGGERPAAIRAGGSGGADQQRARPQADPALGK